MRRAVAYIKQAELLGERFLDISENENTILNARAQISAANAMQNELAAQRAYEDLLERVGALSNEVNQGASSLRLYQYNVVRTSVAPPYMKDAQVIVDELNADITYQVNNASARRYIIANRQLERHLFQGESRLEEGNSLLEGHEREIQGVKFIAKYPIEAAATLTQMEQDLDEGLELGAVLLVQYKKEDPNVLASQEMQALYSAAQTTVNRLEILRQEGRTRGETARNLASQAEALRIDGDRLYREAEAALVQSNFDAARDRLTRTGERYDASLVIEDDDNLRAVRDDRLLRLGAEITRLENERIIREVRELVNQAKTTYYAGNFEQSEEMLVRAQNRWRVTNAEPNPEVVYWLTLVRGALSLRSGRIIPPTAPLYPEMSQLLSEAKKNYDEGVRFFNADRRSDGLAKFNAAREKTREVKLMFPINEEAGLLDLRMDQIADPAVFNASFQQRLNAAVSGTKQRSTQAYADLQNLAVINPRYPGMRSILDQAEIDMGIRPPPPDPRDLAQSAELTNQALAIINANVRAQFEVAKEQLSQAIRLNPNNGTASEALDRVNNLIGGSDTIVLTNNAEAEFQRAVREFQQGNTIVAMAIVQQLLQDPRNRTSKILDLQRRIESML
jgi:CO dehydrogenase/acetyl-CoA synthase epsilon subunit